MLRKSFLIVLKHAACCTLLIPSYLLVLGNRRLPGSSRPVTGVCDHWYQQKKMGAGRHQHEDCREEIQLRIAAKPRLHSDNLWSRKVPSSIARRNQLVFFSQNQDWNSGRQTVLCFRKNDTTPWRTVFQREPVIQIFCFAFQKKSVVNRRCGYQLIWEVTPSGYCRLPATKIYD